jgi:hypothetical protein
MAHVAAHFSKDRMCRETLDVYRELAFGPGGTARQVPG